MERDDEIREQGQGFLPPEPAGPEPELGDPPQASPPPPAPQPPPGPPQPAHRQHTYGYPPPPGQPPYHPPPGYGAPPGQAYPAWGYPQQPPVPDNGQAVAGFVLSLVSIGLLVISIGFSSLVSIGCAIAGIICSRNGRRDVDAGKTPKHRGLAQAGYVVGWVSLGLSVLATIAWIAVLASGIEPGN